MTLGSEVVVRVRFCVGGGDRLIKDTERRNSQGLDAGVAVCVVCSGVCCVVCGYEGKKGGGRFRVLSFSGPDTRGGRPRGGSFFFFFSYFFFPKRDHQ